MQLFFRLKMSSSSLNHHHLQLVSGNASIVKLATRPRQQLLSLSIITILLVSFAQLQQQLPPATFAALFVSSIPLLWFLFAAIPLKVFFTRLPFAFISPKIIFSLALSIPPPGASFSQFSPIQLLLPIALSFLFQSIFVLPLLLRLWVLQLPPPLFVFTKLLSPISFVPSQGTPSSSTLFQPVSFLASFTLLQLELLQLLFFFFAPQLPLPSGAFQVQLRLQQLPLSISPSLKAPIFTSPPLPFVSAFLGAPLQVPAAALTSLLLVISAFAAAFQLSSAQSLAISAFLLLPTREEFSLLWALRALLPPIGASLPLSLTEAGARSPHTSASMWPHAERTTEDSDGGGRTWARLGKQRFWYCAFTGSLQDHRHLHPALTPSHHHR